jgi:guanylate kinase
LKKKSSNRGLLVVISGPGGVGKSTISNYLNAHPDFWLSISATTRAPREGESHGVDYFFVTDTEFDLMIKNGEFLEWAEFAGNRYGTPIKGVEEKLSLGKNVLLEIEIAGARQIRKLEMNALFVFISPPSWEELESRLISRGTDSEERRLARLALAREEMDAANEFDEILVNTAVNEVALALVSLVARKRGDF